MGGERGEDSEEAGGDGGSFLHGFAEMLAQMVLGLGRFAV